MYRQTLDVKEYMTDLLQTIERYRALGIDQQIDYKKFYLYSIITHSTALSLDDKGKQYENYLVGPYEEIKPAIGDRCVCSESRDGYKNYRKACRKNYRKETRKNCRKDS